MPGELDLEEISHKLDVLINLLAYQTVEKMTITQGAPLLRRLGFTASEIAAIYGTNRNVVNVRLAEAKKKEKKSKKGV